MRRDKEKKNGDSLLGVTEGADKEVVTVLEVDGVSVGQNN